MTYEPWQARLGTTNFDPLQVLDMQDAIRKRKKIVDVQGRKFKLSYNKEKGTVYYCLADGSFGPCGYLDIKRFLED